MPSATTLGGLGFLNNGPLTTTFTAPASCSTAGFYTEIAYASDISEPFYGVDCTSIPAVDCKPSGPVITSLATALGAGNPAAYNLGAYYSPGLVCPAGWTTAGAATKVNPTSTTISGAAFSLNASALIQPDDPFFFDPWTDAFLSALDPKETAVACCPSSYSWAQGNCYSTIPTSAFRPSAGCVHNIPNEDVTNVPGTWTIGGETITAVEVQITGTATESATIRSMTLKPSETASYIAVAVGDPVFLVHKAADKTGDKTGAAARVGDGAKGWGLLATAYCAILSLGAILAL